MYIDNELKIPEFRMISGQTEDAIFSVTGEAVAHPESTLEFVDFARSTASRFFKDGLFPERGDILSRKDGTKYKVKSIIWKDTEDHLQFEVSLQPFGQKGAIVIRGFQ